jgi:hypothetical protein
VLFLLSFTAERFRRRYNQVIAETLSQNTPVKKAFDSDVGIIDMHIGETLWAISGKYLDIVSPHFMTFTLQIFT